MRTGREVCVFFFLFQISFVCFGVVLTADVFMAEVVWGSVISHTSFSKQNQLCDLTIRKIVHVCLFSLLSLCFLSILSLRWGGALGAPFGKRVLRNTDKKIPFPFQHYRREPGGRTLFHLVWLSLRRLLVVVHLRRKSPVLSARGYLPTV